MNGHPRNDPSHPGLQYMTNGVPAAMIRHPVTGHFYIPDHYDEPMDLDEAILVLEDEDRHYRERREHG